MNDEMMMEVADDEPASTKRWYRRHFENGIPADALTWNNYRQRYVQLRLWRNATCKMFENSTRVVRLAWILRDLFVSKGFCFAKDTTIGVELIDVPRSKIQKSLLELERAGAIIRASRFVEGRHGKDKPQRRIWPCVRVIQRIFPDQRIVPDPGPMDSPRRGSKDSPRVGDICNLKESPDSVTSMTRTQRASRAAAMIDAQRHRKPKPGRPKATNKRGRTT
jgi:hypothetical protein